MLTDQDAKQMGFVFGIGARVVRAIEAAVLSKLAAGVSVEPVHHIMSDGVSIGYYSLDQLTAAIAAARVQENERCVQALEALWHSNDDSTKKCINAIRALIGKEST